MNIPKTGEEIIQNVYVFAELPNLDSNIYILRNKNNELMLIDAGNGLNSENFITGMKNINLNPSKITKIVVSHEHIDHILGIYNIPELTGTKPEILALGRTKETIEKGDQDAIIPKALGINLSVFGIEIKKLPVFELEEGDKLIFGEFDFSVLYTPGHSLGSMTLYEEKKKILFPGDVVFSGGSFGRFDFPGGNLSDLKKSIERLMSLDVSILCPGHMNYSKSGNNELKRSHTMINNFY
ncbi:MAG: MBL fold metallo-hydrolase [Promethearchaeota archaeon]